jgi:hypothetical protein
MARKIKNPVVVTMTKSMGERLFDVLYRQKASRLASIVIRDIETQVGNSFTMELTRGDAIAMQRAALEDIRLKQGTLTAKQHRQIELAFFKAYDARLRNSHG